MYLYSGGLIINVLLVNEICGGAGGGGVQEALSSERLYWNFTVLSLFIFF